MKGAEAPSPDAFFASRAGVCVYVNVRGQPVRICFTSVDAAGSAAAGTPAELADEAAALATEVFRAHRALLEPLFEAIASASATGN